MNPLIQLKQKTPAFFLTFGLCCFAPSPLVQAISPTLDGCYPNFTTPEGCNALRSLTTGAANTALGWRALFSDSTGGFNTAAGGGALLFSNGDSNTAVGAAALLLDSTGSNNTAVGTGTLVNNTVDGNTATGAFALFANTIGGTVETVEGWDLGPNTAVGSHTLENNVDGSANTAIGYNALFSQIHGGALGQLPQLGGNTAVGFKALASVTGSMGADNALNTALGYHALFDLTNGRVNTAVGALAGEGLTTGVGNVNVGIEAGFGNITGSGNIFIGDLQGPTTSGETGHTYIGNIRSTSLPVGGSIDVVTIDTSSGLLGHNSSSRRYKDDIKPLDQASETLYRLKPVSYHLQKEADRNRSQAFGLIAEEVAEVNPDLIVRNAQGEIEGVHYEMVNTMLLNEFLKEHQKVHKLEAALAAVNERLKKQDAKIDKVNAKVELTVPARQVANSSQ